MINRLLFIHMGFILMLIFVLAALAHCVEVLLRSSDVQKKLLLHSLRHHRSQMLVMTD